MMHIKNSESHYTHFHLRNFKYSKLVIKIFPTFSATAFSKQGFHDQILSIIKKKKSTFLFGKKNVVEKWSFL